MVEEVNPYDLSAVAAADRAWRKMNRPELPSAVDPKEVNPYDLGALATANHVIQVRRGAGLPPFVRRRP